MTTALVRGRTWILRCGRSLEDFVLIVMDGEHDKGGFDQARWLFSAFCSISRQGVWMEVRPKRELRPLKECAVRRCVAWSSLTASFSSSRMRAGVQGTFMQPLFSYTFLIWARMGDVRTEMRGVFFRAMARACWHTMNQNSPAAACTACPLPLPPPRHRDPVLLERVWGGSRRLRRNCRRCCRSMKSPP